MSRLFPALDIPRASPDDEALGRLLAALDDSAPVAVEERPDGVRIFFNSAADRDRGLVAIRGCEGASAACAVDVPDENWAARSQAALGAVRIGRIVVAPPWDSAVRSRRTPNVTPTESAQATRDRSTGGGGQADLLIVIQPSMGFGTGHHPSTRLCLEQLQQRPVAGRSVLDVGTGSGVLAIAAWKLGAAHVVGIDVDADAMASAHKNVELNDATGSVDLRLTDFTVDAPDLGGPFGIVTANLTGAMIERTADALAALVSPGGRLIASGFQGDEVAGVTAALYAAGLTAVGRGDEDGWVAMNFDVRTSKFEL